jgi:hypothetical protein
LDPPSDVKPIEDPSSTTLSNNISKQTITNQAEEARKKKLEFFRALGQATLEELEQQKNADEKSPRITSMSLFDSSIVSLTSKSALEMKYFLASKYQFDVTFSQVTIARHQLRLHNFPAVYQPIVT